MVSREQMTVADFEAFANRPENADKRFEFIDGEVMEVPSNPFVSEIAQLIGFFIRLFLRENNLKGHVTGEGGGFVIDGHILAPDVAYMEQPPTNKGYHQTPPLLAVEVLSDPHSNTEQRDLRRKLVHYRQAGVVVWVVDYLTRQVEVHIPDQAVTLLNEDDMLKGGDLLPGFEVAVKDIFPEV